MRGSGSSTGRGCKRLVFIAQAIKPRFGGEINAAISDGWRAVKLGVTAVFHREFFGVESFALRRNRIQNVEHAILFGNINSAIRPNRRTFADSAKIILPQALAGGRLNRDQIRGIVNEIKYAIVERRRRITHFEIIDAPHFVRFRDVTLAAPINAYDAAHAAVVEILFAVAGENMIAVDD